MSTWPEAKASVRAVVSAMKAMRSAGLAGGPAKCCAKAESATPCVGLTLSTWYGPVPIGSIVKASPRSSNAFLQRMLAEIVVTMLPLNSGSGRCRWKRTV
jgi:hypothetical protein